MPKKVSSRQYKSKHKELGGAGVASHTRGSHELNAEHMVSTSGVVPPGSVPPPDAEMKRPRKAKKVKKEKR